MTQLMTLISDPYFILAGATMGTLCLALFGVANYDRITVFLKKN